MLMQVVIMSEDVVSAQRNKSLYDRFTKATWQTRATHLQYSEAIFLWSKHWPFQIVFIGNSQFCTLAFLSACNIRKCGAP